MIEAKCHRGGPIAKIVGKLVFLGLDLHLFRNSPDQPNQERNRS